MISVPHPRRVFLGCRLPGSQSGLVFSKSEQVPPHPPNRFSAQSSSPELGHAKFQLLPYLLSLGGTSQGTRGSELILVIGAVMGAVSKVWKDRRRRHAGTPSPAQPGLRGEAVAPQAPDPQPPRCRLVLTGQRAPRSPEGLGSGTTFPP